MKHLFLKTKIPIFLIPVFFLLNVLNLSAQSFECGGGSVTSEIEINSCDALFNYDLSDYESLPIITVKCNIYYKQASNGENFQDLLLSDTSSLNGTKFAVDLMWFGLNHKFQNLQTSTLGNGSFLDDPKIRWVLKTDANDADGIYYVDSNFVDEFVHDDVVNILVFNTDTTSATGSGAAHGINLYNALKYRYTSLYIYPGVLAHEFGHWFGLCHSFYPGNECAGIDLNVGAECHGTADSNVSCGKHSDGCDPCHSGSNNIMGYCNAGSAGAITPCQWERMYTNAIMKLGRPEIEFDCGTTGDPIVIPSDSIVVWDKTKLVFNKVIVSPRARLTINCNVLLSSTAIIEVQRGGKLQVNYPAELRNLCQGTRWPGIEVWGFADSIQPEPTATLTENDAGVVILDGCTIRNANSGVSTLASSISWPANPEYYGGVVVGDHCKFINCRRGAQFMKHLSPNKSKFEGCVFKEEGAGLIPVAGSNNKSYGVTIWRCQGIDFQQNQFEDLDIVGTFGVDMETKFSNSNLFRNVGIGIDNESTYPGASVIKVLGDTATPNIFTDNRIHIHSKGTELLGGLTVAQNEFYNGESAIEIFSESNFFIEYNLFQNRNGYFII